jgi:ribonuclease HII
MVHRFMVGVDENGLGPRLGPLVVTAISARTSEEGNRRAARAPRGRLATRLGDSKKLVAFGDDTLGEAWARALARRLSRPAESPAELFRALALDPDTSLREPCPAPHVDQCWSSLEESFQAPDALVDEVQRDLAELQAKGIDVCQAHIAVVCAKRLNEAAVRGTTRFHLDLHAMERLALAARELAGEEISAVCGKVGGFDRYAPHFGPLGGRLHVALEEGRARSEYRIPGFGTIGFVRDADARHLLVCMASLVGKWARDLFMSRIVRYHRAENPDLPNASGYHDPVTSRFIRASALVRRRRALPDACFERMRAATDFEDSPAPPAKSADPLTSSPR